MSEQAGSTARALFEQQAHAAMTRYDHNLGEYTRKIAYNTLIDELLKAWEKTALHALDQRVREQIAASLTASRQAVLERVASESWVAAGKRNKEARTG